MKIRPALILTALASSQLQSPIFDETSNKPSSYEYQYHRQPPPLIVEYRNRARNMVCRFKEKMGCPGISVCVSLSGNIIYQEGIGYANVEHMVPVKADTVFRIASISKPFTSLLVGRLLDQGKLDLDEDIRTYLPEFPEKMVDNKYAKITIRTLLNHTSGIRSYKKNTDKNKELDYPEMLSNVRFEDTMNACDMFKNDPLVHTPGVQFTYSTFAFTLLSAVIEKVCLLKGDLFERSSPTVKMELNTSDNDNKGNKGKKSNNLPKWARFDTHLSRLFQYLSLSNTSLEYPEEITSSRAGQYRRSEKGVLTNTPTIDNSYKWAGGGILSTAIDLVRFADHLAFIYMGWLDSYGIVKRSTLSQLWEVSCVPPDQKTLPGLGWFLARRSGDPATVKTDYPDRLFALHTGGAVGGTTVLLISVPLLKDEVKHLNSTKINSSIENDNAKNIDRKYPTDIRLKSADIPPISVAILTNLENVSGISGLAIQLSELFLDYALQELVD